ncbi:alpha-amylase family glycosyl hydrolase [Candidatus Saccharibacteria bacterium]|nr:alpha-amylase family glycosyl hydrolase [Candidatus Saccharibacteria bacterium]
MKKKLKILEYDAYLTPFKEDLMARAENLERAKWRMLGGRTLGEFANGHHFYGFHKTREGWVYREWAPNADMLFLMGDFNGWDKRRHPMKYIGSGNFEIHLTEEDGLEHGSRVKVHVCAGGKSFDRIPLYIKRVVQQADDSFDGEIWEPEKKYRWKSGEFQRNTKEPLFIYEAHVGIASEEYKVASYAEFTRDVLPRIQKLGYNAIQLMAVMEHPYYGSFGYQVSNFFAVSSRFGAPDDLKKLIDTAHGMGIAVILDIVHSHAVGNELEGMGKFDGTSYQFFHEGERGEHPAWGTKLFNYGKPEVVHFLLSNIKFWLDEYRLDGFRFDGITSMLYHDQGMQSFMKYDQYFSPNTDVDAVVYLQLATELAKETKKDCVLIAEDMSGMPGMCIPVKEGGIGFDYRLAMGMPDFWIKTLKGKKDEDWDLGEMWHELTQRRPMEKVIGYSESHDQALVGDKTIMMWLADAEIYTGMSRLVQSHRVDRAVALHKMIRLVTAACAGEGYMNFMGNEFGHPEWIDFPREGNGWSFEFARRQWSLVDDELLRYGNVREFDEAMVELLKRKEFLGAAVELVLHDEMRRVLVFRRAGYLFVFNFNAHEDWVGKVRITDESNVEIVLDSEWKKFGGWKEDGDGEVKCRKVQDRISVEVDVSKRSVVVVRAA